MTTQASRDYVIGDNFVALAQAYCNDIEIKLAKFESSKATESKTEIANYLQNRTEEQSIKNMLFKPRGLDTVIWLTFKPETTHITPRTMLQIKRLVESTKMFTDVIWPLRKKKACISSCKRLPLLSTLRKAFFLPPIDKLTCLLKTYWSFRLIKFLKCRKQTSSPSKRYQI